MNVYEVFTNIFVNLFHHQMSIVCSRRTRSMGNFARDALHEVDLLQYQYCLGGREWFHRPPKPYLVSLDASISNYFSFENRGL